MLAAWPWFCSASLKSQAQEKPYFVTYSQDMEEPGNLDIETYNVVGNPKGGDAFLGSDIEFEYGVNGLVDHRVLSRRAGHAEPKHHLHRLSLGEPLSSLDGRALDQSRALRRV